MIPSPHNLVHRAFIAVHGLHHVFEDGIEQFPCLLGVAFGQKLEPLRSAKRTVTCFRSPSRAALEVRIFSARCFGV
jgi:hypothetical protein